MVSGKGHDPTRESVFDLIERLTSAIDAMPEGTGRQVAALHACARTLETAAYDVLTNDNADFAAELVTMAVRVGHYLGTLRVTILEAQENAETRGLGSIG